MLRTELELLKSEAEAMLEKFRAGIAHTEDDFLALVARAANALGMHNATRADIGATADSNTENPQPAEGVQVITGSADASAGIPAGYAPIANADPAPADPAPAA